MKTIPPFIHIPVFPFSRFPYSIFSFNSWPLSLFLSYSIPSFFPLSTSNPLSLFPPSLTWVPLHPYSLLMTDNLECLSAIWCWRDGKTRRKWASCTCVRSHFLNCPERDLSAYVWISRTCSRYQSTYPLFQVWHMTVLLMPAFIAYHTWTDLQYMTIFCEMKINMFEMIWLLHKLSSYIGRFKINFTTKKAIRLFWFYFPPFKSHTLTYMVHTNTHKNPHTHIILVALTQEHTHIHALYPPSTHTETNTTHMHSRINTHAHSHSH